MEQPKFENNVVDSQTFEKVPSPEILRERFLAETEAGINEALEQAEAHDRAPEVFGAISNSLKDHMKNPESEQDMDPIPPAEAKSELPEEDMDQI
ncbi:MAG TPA: hypothetical protein VEB60_00135 [Candidatus Paceibacterota bacterium]|nr:hypothetical protein [Candidatus Paceibacterota bacterium]